MAAQTIRLRAPDDSLSSAESFGHRLTTIKLFVRDNSRSALRVLPDPGPWRPDRPHPTMAHAAPKRNRSMSRPVLLLALLVPLPALAKLEVRNVQPAHGPLGPARTSDDVYPLDEY